MTRILDEILHRDVEALFDAIEDTQFWIKDAENRYLRVNQTFLLNYSVPDESYVIGKTDYDLSPPYLADQFFEDDQRVLRGERICGRIELVGGSDQSVRWFSTTKVPLRSRDGNDIVASSGITRCLPDARSTAFPVPELVSVIEFIQNNFDQPVSNRDLASLANLSVSALERKFRRYFHTSPMQFIKRLRVTRACHALLFTERRISDIAQEFGYCDQSYFNREFKRHFGTTPKEYKKRHRGYRG